MVKQKVGHGLRDARIAANEHGDELALRPKIFRPSVASKNLASCLTPSVTIEAIQNKEGCAGKSVSVRLSKRWSLCFAQPQVDDVPSATFDHHRRESFGSCARDSFFMKTVVSPDDLPDSTSTLDTDASDFLGNALSVCDDAESAFVDWGFDDPVHRSSFTCEDGQSLLQWFREFS